MASVAAGAVTSLPLYVLLRATPAWWLPAWVLFAAFTLLWQVAAPVAMKARASTNTITPPELAARVESIAA